jgi:hypothetical protein
MKTLKSTKDEEGRILEEFTCTLSCMLKLGTPSFIYVQQHPDTWFRANKVSVNVPCENMVWLGALMCANVNTMVGGLMDAHCFKSAGQSLDMPTLSPANRFVLIGWYNGMIPPGYEGKAGTDFLFDLTLTGTSTLVEGAGP